MYMYKPRLPKHLACCLHAACILSSLSLETWGMYQPLSVIGMPLDLYFIFHYNGKRNEGEGSVQIDKLWLMRPMAIETDTH